MTDNLSKADAGSISASEVRKLLHQIYGFKRNQHREGRETWDWIHDDMILVRSVVGWTNLPEGVLDVKKIAANLGLEFEDFEKALSGSYTQSCLLFVLFIYQVHRHLDILGAWIRGQLLENATGFLKAVGSASFGPHCRDLIRKQDGKINDISHYPETEVLGQELRRIASQLGS